MQVGKKWRRMAEIYRQFSEITVSDEILAVVPDAWLDNVLAHNANRDYCEEAMAEAYARETFGADFDIRRSNGKINGYIEGKQNMDLTITDYWLPDLHNRELFSAELFSDPRLPQWFLERVLPERFHVASV